MHHNSQDSQDHQNKRINSESKKVQNDTQIDFESIYDLYKKEFSYHCEKLLIKSRNDILDSFFAKMISIIKYYYKFENKESLDTIIKKCENDFISNEYIPMYNALSLTFSIIATNLSTKNKIKYFYLNKNLNYINNFIPHCVHHKRNNEYAIHTCGEKLIQINKNIIKSNSKNINNYNRDNIKYILCPKCKKSYKYNLILMFCKYCEKEYFSKLMKDKNANIYPVTWEKYHCVNSENNNDINNYKYESQMPCIKCKSKLFLKKNKLFCENCKFEIEAMNLVWTCFKCNKEFRSNAKIYNNLNYTIIKHIIRDAFIQLKIVKPVDLPCDCLKKYKIDNINFYHKKEGRCNGILYYNSFNNKDYIICSLCKYICYLNDFNWFCPFCLKYFITNKIKIYVKKNDDINLYVKKSILENKPKTRRYFSPNTTINIQNKITNDNDKINSDMGMIRLCESQRNLDENKNKYAFEPKNIDIYKNINKNTVGKIINSNIKNSQTSTLYTSYQKDSYKQIIKYKKKINSCNTSLDNIIKNKNRYDISEKNSATKPKKSNMKIYISNKKIQSKFIIPKKNIISINKFNIEQKNKNNNNKNFMRELSNSLKKHNIKLTKPKVNISSSLILGMSDNEPYKETIDDMSNFNINHFLDNEKMIYSNRTKRNKCISSKKNKNNMNNNCLSVSINNNYDKLKKYILNNKTSDTSYNKKKEKDNIKNIKLSRLMPSYAVKNEIYSERKK